MKAKARNSGNNGMESATTPWRESNKMGGKCELLFYFSVSVLRSRWLLSEHDVAPTTNPFQR
jgi:hypothetical protein